MFGQTGRLDYLERGGVTGVGFTMEELKLLKVFAWEVAAANSDAEDIMGRLAGRGTEPGGRFPRKGNGGFEAPIDERAADAAAAWR